MSDSSAASKFVFSAVFSILICLVDWPEFISIETKASVGLMTKYPPDFNFTVGSNILFSSFSILRHEIKVFYLIFFNIFNVFWHQIFHEFFAFW